MAPIREVAARLYRLLTLSDTSLAEACGSWTLLSVGFWLIMPFDTFEALPVYEHMKQIAPEAVWGIVSLSLGLFQTLANVRQVREARRVAAYMGGTFFAVIAALAFVSLPQSLLTPFCACASLMEGFISLHLRGTAEERAHGGA